MADQEPIERINFQSWAPDCSGCGESIAEADVRHTRHEGPPGIIGYAPWCPACRAKYVEPAALLLGRPEVLES